MNFRQVHPYPCFVNGKASVVEHLNVRSIYDNLEDNVIFEYELATIDGVFCGIGRFELNAETYSTWDASSIGAYQIVCAGVGLELVEVTKSVSFEV
jgi:hypothetical protein